MITRECRGGPYVVQCDECTDVEELEGNELSEAAKDAQERGFSPIFFHGTWQHFCNYCFKQRAA